MNKSNLFFAATSFALGILALIFQFNFAIDYWMASGLSLWAAVGQYFSYYTIIINTFACICLTLIFANKKSRVRKFLISKSILSVVVVNLLFVAIGYNLLLRNLWHPVGIEFYINEILHSIMPVMFIIFYYLFVPAGKLKRSNIFSWLLLPLTYLIVILIRGELTGFYPYPFLEPYHSGYRSVFFYVITLLIGYFGISLIFISVENNRKLNKLRKFL